MSMNEALKIRAWMDLKGNMPWNNELKNFKEKIEKLEKEIQFLKDKLSGRNRRMSMNSEIVKISAVFLIEELSDLIKKTFFRDIKKHPKFNQIEKLVEDIAAIISE